MQQIWKYHFEKKREVSDYIYLRDNYLKLTVYYFLCVISALFVFVLVNSVQDLKKYIYDQVDSIDKADYVFLLLDNDNREVIPIQKIKCKITPDSPPAEFLIVNYANKKFYYSKKKRCFRILGNRFAHQMHKKPEKLIPLLKPLNENEYKDLRKSYGVNNFTVMKKSFFDHFFHHMTQPIHLFNICASVYFLTYEIQYAYAVKITFYLMLMYSIRRWEYVKEVENVNKTCDLKTETIIYRTINNTIVKITISSSEVTIGDIVEINSGEIINFDCIIFSGTCIVDQSTLTGETIPIIKRNIVEDNSIKDYNTILAGSKCLQKKSNKVFGIITAVGFDSFQGNLISVMTAKKLMPFRFYQDLTKLFSFFLVIFLTFLVYVVIKDFTHNNFSFDRTLSMFVQLCIQSFPLSIYVSLFLAERIVSHKLRKNNITKVSTDYIVKAGRMNLVCFDKTGTLTEDSMKLNGLILPHEDNLGDVVNNLDTIPPLNQQRITELMACCNSIDVINGNIVGDPIEVAIQKLSGFLFENLENDIQIDDEVAINAPEYFRQKQNIKETLSFKIVPTYEFKTKFDISSDFAYNIKKYIHFDPSKRRMSVVINNPNDGSKYTVLMKGAPEVIPQYCIKDTIPSNYDAIFDNYSKRGLRLLAMCYKEVDSYKKEDEELEENMKFLGLLVFVNPLKPDVKEVIRDLRVNDIKSIMITGDALNTAVNVGYASGIIQSGKNVWIGQLDIDKKVMKWYKSNENDITKSNEIGIERPVTIISSKNNSALSQASDDVDDLRKDLDTKLHYCMAQNDVIAIDGDTMEYLVDKYMDEKVFLELLFEYTVIYGRTNPHQKKLIVKYHKLLRYRKDLTVGFVGDGANDAEALHEADVGLSLGNQLSSMVASYYTSEDKICKIKTLSIEGKFALASSIEILSYSVYANITSNFTLLFMGLFSLNYTGYEFFGKLAYFLPFYILLAYTGSSDKMTYHYPEPGFLKKAVFMPFLFSTITLILLTVELFLVLSNDPTFKDVTQIVYETKHISCNDHNFFQNKLMAFFWLFRSCFLIWAVSIGAPFKKSVITNVPGVAYSIFLIIYNTSKFLESYIGIYWYQYFLVKVVRWPNMYRQTAVKYLLLFFVSGFLTLFVYQVTIKYYLLQKMSVKQKAMERGDDIRLIHQNAIKNSKPL